MNNKVVIAIIVVIVLLGGYFLLNKKNTNDVASTNESASMETEMKAETGSIQSLLESGSERKCTYSNTQEGYASEGTFYVAKGKMRGDITTNVNGKASITHMINNGADSYIWTDDNSVAYKMAFNPNDAKQVADANATASQNTAIDLQKDYDFKCSSWNGDSSKFELPSGVEFKDMSALTGAMGGAMSAGANASGSLDTKAMQQNICNSLSGSSKEQCLNSIK